MVVSQAPRSIRLVRFEAHHDGRDVAERDEHEVSRGGAPGVPGHALDIARRHRRRRAAGAGPERDTAGQSPRGAAPDGSNRRIMEARQAIRTCPHEVPVGAVAGVGASRGDH